MHQLLTYTQLFSGHSYFLILNFSIFFNYICFPPQELLYEANTKQFKCVNPQKSEHTKVLFMDFQSTVIDLCASSPL